MVFFLGIPQIEQVYIKTLLQPLLLYKCNRSTTIAFKVRVRVIALSPWQYILFLLFLPLTLPTWASK